MSQIKIKCEKCDHEFVVDVEYEHVDSNSDRGMGDEKIYEAVVDVECPICCEHITGTIEYWEYPEGVVDHKSDDNLDGASVVEYGIECGLN